MKNKLILMILSLLGLATACSEEENSCEYGTPYVTFSVKGKVTDTDGAPVPGIRVAVSEDAYAPATTTGADGAFAFDKTPFYMGHPEKLIFTDIDGAANGEFGSKTLDVAFEKSDSKPESNWNTGYYTAPDVEVCLNGIDGEQEE